MRNSSTAPVPPVPTGVKLGVYVIDELIGRDGRGQVYRARDTQANRLVALKIVSPTLAVKGARFARFQREARTGALLNHPNIATVLDLGCDDGVPFVVSELLRGTTLRRLIERAPLGVGLAVDYARQVSRGLAAAHQVGVPHRDLRPENIFVTAEGCVKILDFGLAKNQLEALELLQADDSSPSEVAAVLRRISYLSPEQVRGEEAGDHSDLFSLGVILYEMLSGALPFTGHSTIDTLNSILSDEPRPLDLGDGDVGRELNRVVRRCLEKDPADRFQSAGDLLVNLELAVAAAARGVPPVPPVASTNRLLHLS